LPQDDIPAKLRCAICSKLALNAFRLPCCEQAICESCQSALPASCPVCEHSPLSADDCKPHKALRTTIKVFLRTEEKKRESNRPKDVATTPITPVDPSPIFATAPAAFERPSVGEGVGATQEQQAPVAEQGAEAGVTTENQEGGEPGSEEVQQQATEKSADDAVGHHSSNQSRTSANKHQEQTSQDVAEGEGDGATSTELVLAQQGSEVAEGDDAEAAKEGNEEGDVEEINADGSGVVQPEGMSGTFPPAGFTPGFDQMPMMMAMQNGFGNFPMMG
jgi:hypothetical protein